MLPHPAKEPAISREAQVVTKAATRAADRLGLKNNVLCRVVGLSEPTMHRSTVDFPEPLRPVRATASDS